MGARLAGDGGGADARGVAERSEAGAGGSGPGAGSGRGTRGGHADVDDDAAGVLARGGRVLSAAARLARPSAVGAGAGTAWSSSPQLIAAPTGMSPPQTEQRARIETLVIFAGSIRKIDRHSGQETFI